MSAALQGFPRDAAAFNHFGQKFFPGFVGVKIESLEQNSLRATLDVRAEHLAPNGFLHAGAVVTLADTAAGYACVANLPEGANSFTTIELKSNFFGTARDGRIVADARLVHGGRTTQVWDVEVRRADETKPIALFRCTQMILYPRPETSR